MTDAILGIDLGTTEVKAGLVGLDGTLLGLARAGYGLEVGHGPGWAEQDPGRVVVGRRRRGPRPASDGTVRTASAVDIVAIGVDGHGPTLVPVDDRGEATRPAITFLDTRAAAEADELEAATGVRGWGLGPLPAALWVERHEPDGRGGHALVPDDLGVAGLPADRRGASPRSSRTRPSRTRPWSVAATGLRDRPPTADHGASAP